MPSHEPRTRPAPAVVREELGTAGKALDGDSARSFGEQLGHDLSGVRVHTGPRAAASAASVGAKAYTVGERIVFGAGRYQPETAAGRNLLAHELTHVVQQRATAAASPVTGPADRAVETDPRARRQGGVLAYSDLSERLAALRDRPKGEVFDRLRTTTGGIDTEALAVLQGRFAEGTDDRWLATALLDYGPEPLWPAALIEERASRAAAGHWDAEQGNIAAMLPVPAGDDTTAVPPIPAYFFPGKTGHRALVIGGVHGNEPQGVDVVESLRAELARMAGEGKTPYYATILVPVLNRRTHDADQAARGARYLPRSPGDRPAQTEKNGIEPNRTFPVPGENLADVGNRASGRPELRMREKGHPDRALKGEHTARSIPPETRALIALIERFRPERIASVHAHSIGKQGARQGNDPGIFVDPAVTNTGAIDPAGDKLGRDMLSDAKARRGTLPKVAQNGRMSPFLGNVDNNVRYSPTAIHAEGYSLGDWAPAPTASRAGITTVTVEVPQYSGTTRKEALPPVENMHRDVLRDIFLGPPRP